MAGKRTESITSYTAPGPRGQKVDFLLGDALAAEPYALIQVTASMASSFRKQSMAAVACK